MSASIVTGKVRLSYVNVFEPQTPQGGGDPKYSATILMPKSDTMTMQVIQAAINEATQEGVSKRWDGKMPAKIDIPIHDGDGGRPSDGEPFGEECRGCWIFTASAKQKPGIVDQRVQPIMDSTQVYSGMYAYVDINFYAYNSNGKKGIGIGLNNVQKVADGEALAGRRSASEAFKPIDMPAAAVNPFQAAAPQPAQAAYGYPQQGQAQNPYQPAPQQQPINPYQPQTVQQQPANPMWL